VAERSATITSTVYDAIVLTSLLSGEEGNVIGDIDEASSGEGEEGLLLVEG
jgi:hypothetical protein